MLRTSRQLGSNLGGWVVPADVIRMLWPEEAGRGNDRFHQQDPTLAARGHASSSRLSPTETAHRRRAACRSGRSSRMSYLSSLAAISAPSTLRTTRHGPPPRIRDTLMADDDTDTGTESAPDQQASDDAGESKPEGKKDDGKDEGKGKDDKKPDSKKEDDEQERKDQFAEAAGDPLADALGGSSSRAGESQAYRSWIRTVRASGAALRRRRDHRRPQHHHRLGHQLTAAGRHQARCVRKSSPSWSTGTCRRPDTTSS